MYQAGQQVHITAADASDAVAAEHKCFQACQLMQVAWYSIQHVVCDLQDVPAAAAHRALGCLACNECWHAVITAAAMPAATTDALPVDSAIASGRVSARHHGLIAWPQRPLSQVVHFVSTKHSHRADNLQISEMCHIQWLTERGLAAPVS